MRIKKLYICAFKTLQKYKTMETQTGIKEITYGAICAKRDKRYLRLCEKYEHGFYLMLFTDTRGASPVSYYLSKDGIFSTPRYSGEWCRHIEEARQSAPPMMDRLFSENIRPAMKLGDMVGAPKWAIARLYENACQHTANKLFKGGFIHTQMMWATHNPCPEERCFFAIDASPLKTASTLRGFIGIAKNMCLQTGCTPHYLYNLLNGKDGLRRYKRWRRRTGLFILQATEYSPASGICMRPIYCGSEKWTVKNVPHFLDINVGDRIICRNEELGIFFNGMASNYYPSKNEFNTDYSLISEDEFLNLFDTTL